MSFFSEKMYLPRDTDKKTDVYYQRFFSMINGTILEIGCSTGNFVALDPKNIMGIDIDEDAVKVAKKRGLTCQVMNVDGNRLDFNDNTFDAINIHSVFEHLNHPIKSMKEFYRILKPNGKLVLMAPDAKKAGHIFWDDYTHKRPYNKESLKRIAYDIGFGDIDTFYEPMPIKGLGWGVRKGLFSAKTAIKLQNILLMVGITHKNVFLICRK